MGTRQASEPKRYVALLRGINVGGHRVKLDDLRRMFSELGLEDVVTFLASGNVIFSAASEDEAGLTGRIELHLADRLGYEVPTFLRAPAELGRVASFRPPGHAEGRSLYVIFLRAPADDELRTRFAEVDSESDRFTVSGREVYWSIEGKLSESPLFGAGLDRIAGDAPATTRNVTSLQRLVAKLEAEELGR